MKRHILSLTILVMGLLLVSCGKSDQVLIENEIEDHQEVAIDYLSNFEGNYYIEAFEASVIYSNKIPLCYKDQKSLQDACSEFDVPYALALAVVEKETDFNNIFGDDGDSVGYMQIQEKWHSDRMEKLGTEDLMNPSDNFRVGLDFLSELYRVYGDWGIALTAYNMGKNPGCISEYAKDILGRYEKWDVIIEQERDE